MDQLSSQTIFFWLIASPQHNTIIKGTGLTFAGYYMVSLASFGTMMSMISSGMITAATIVPRRTQ